jgi:hypothetical protein
MADPIFAAIEADPNYVGEGYAAPTPVNPAVDPEADPELQRRINSYPAANNVNRSATPIDPIFAAMASDPNYDGGTYSGNSATTYYRDLQAQLDAKMNPPVSSINKDASVNPDVDSSAAQADSSSGFSLGGAISEGLGAVNSLVNSPLGGLIQQGIRNARGQPARATQISNEASNGDWRVRLSLAENANYLYNDNSAPNGILQPLQATGGVIFPYTPKIDMSYKANYAPYHPTHSNNRGYFYTNSHVNDITINGKFTAQDTVQANYLLAVIHFLRSATKMFYGQDPQRGSPPPLLFLSGLGQYQFNDHPCLLTSFTYNLPEDVDYIRAQVVNQSNLNLTAQNVVKQAVPVIGAAASLLRLSNAHTSKGAQPVIPFGTGIPASLPSLAQGSPTYVPTKMDISITLLPINTRQQVSQQFSLQNYANGNGLKAGFW